MLCFALWRMLLIFTNEMKHIIGETNYLVIEANHDEEMLNLGVHTLNILSRV